MTIQSKEAVASAVKWGMAVAQGLILLTMGIAIRDLSDIKSRVAVIETDMRWTRTTLERLERRVHELENHNRKENG